MPSGTANEDSAGRIVDAALRLGTVLDISSSPVLWGGQMRGTAALLMVRGGTDVERAPSDKIACDLVQAHLVQILSAIGREWIDFYFLRIRRNLTDWQIDGALMALENAKQEGHVRHLCIECDGPTPEVLQVWHRRDAFEVALLHSPDAQLIQLASQRRVGIVATFPAEFTTLEPFSESLMAGASK